MKEEILCMQPVSPRGPCGKPGVEGKPMCVKHMAQWQKTERAMNGETHRCEGVFRCGTMTTRCRKEATLRKCGQYFCNSCAHWERFTRDTRESVSSVEEPENKRF